MIDRRLDLLQSNVIYELLIKSLSFKHRDFNYITKLLRKIEPLEQRFRFSVLNSDERRRFVSEMGIHVFEPDTKIIEYNDKAYCLYFILAGTCRIYLPNFQEGEQAPTQFIEMGLIGPGTVLGEISILNRSLRSARVVVKQKMRCLSINRNEILRSLDDFKIMENRERVALLRKIFMKFKDSVLGSIAYYMEKHFYKVGQYIYRQKQPITTLHIVVDGIIELVSEFDLDGNKRKEFTAVSQLGPQQVFGEEGLLSLPSVREIYPTHDPTKFRRRVFGACSKYNSTVYTIQTKNLQNIGRSYSLLNPYEHLMIRAITRYDAFHGELPSIAEVSVQKPDLREQLKMKRVRVRPGALYCGRLPHLPTIGYSRWDQQQIKLIRSYSLPQLNQELMLSRLNERYNLKQLPTMSVPQSTGKRVQAVKQRLLAKENSKTKRLLLVRVQI